MSTKYYRAILLIASATLLSAFYITCLKDVFFFDDPFISFKFAKNLIDGNGLVFNRGEPVYGTTAPLFAAILAFVGFISKLPVHKIAPPVNILLAVAVLLLLYSFFYRKTQKNNFSFFITIFFGFIFFTASENIEPIYSGMESCLTIFLLMLFLSAKKVMIKNLFLFLLFFTRFDVGVVVVFSMIALDFFGSFFKNDKLAMRKFYLNCFYLFLLFLLVLVANYALFKEFIPNTIAAKAMIHKGTSFENPLWQRFIRIVRCDFTLPAAIIFWIILITRIFFDAKKKKPQQLYIMFFLAYAFVMLFFIGRHNSWYFPVMSFLLLFNACDFTAERYISICARADCKANVKRTIILVVCFVLAVSIYQGIKFYHLMLKDADKIWETDLYKIAKSLPGESKVFCGDIGIIGYFSDAYIYDYFGLVTRRAIPFNKEKIFYKDGPNISYFKVLQEIAKENPQYIVLRQIYPFTPYLLKELSKNYQISRVGEEYLLKK